MPLTDRFPLQYRTQYSGATLRRERKMLHSCQMIKQIAMASILASNIKLRFCFTTLSLSIERFGYQELLILLIKNCNSSDFAAKTGSYNTILGGNQHINVYERFGLHTSDLSRVSCRVRDAALARILMFPKHIASPRTFVLIITPK